MTRQIAVIGGGAAGFFAAITCAEAAPAAEIVIVERSSTPLAKVELSGGGRCNLTNAGLDLSEFSRHYPRGGRELLGPLHAFGWRDTMAWFEAHGIPLETEPDGRVFPVSGQASDVSACLLRTAAACRIRLQTGTAVTALRLADDSRFCLHLDNGKTHTADLVLLASGGSRQSTGCLAAALGHTIVPPVPALFSFALAEDWLRPLAGIVVEEAEIILPTWQVREHGALLITHWGLSGPAVLRASSWAARELADCGCQCPVVIDFAGGRSPENMAAELQQFARLHGSRHVLTTNPLPIPDRLWRTITGIAGLPENQTWAQLSKSSRETLARLLCRCELHMNGRAPRRDEMVTCGGIALREVHFKTMQSRICPGLYLAGEVLDIDGLTGGFNLQAAWTTGAVAGQAMAAAVR